MMVAFNDSAKSGPANSATLDGPSAEDLARLTDESVDTVLALIADCQDRDVVFVPEDPGAHDAYAEDEADRKLPWTLGHVVVHISASAEEAAAIAAEMARGVPNRGGRSRYEVPWQQVTTLEQCRQRMEESRRIRLASLGMWPERPDLDNRYVYASGKEVNAIGRFMSGLRHDASHFEQIRRIVAQAAEARGADGHR
jgi:hypothetical protein